MLPNVLEKRTHSYNEPPHPRENKCVKKKTPNATKALSTTKQKQLRIKPRSIQNGSRARNYFVYSAETCREAFPKNLAENCRVKRRRHTCQKQLYTCFSSDERAVTLDSPPTRALRAHLLRPPAPRRWVGRAIISQRPIFIAIAA